MSTALCNQQWHRISSLQSARSSPEPSTRPLLWSGWILCPPETSQHFLNTRKILVKCSSPTEVTVVSLPHQRHRCRRPILEWDRGQTWADSPRTAIALSERMLWLRIKSICNGENHDSDDELRIFRIVLVNVAARGRTKSMFLSSKKSSLKEKSVFKIPKSSRPWLEPRILIKTMWKKLPDNWLQHTRDCWCSH